jgi:GNAT superfamily N-acetyltransferase
VSEYGRPRPLERSDRVVDFDSGVASLDGWLARYAHVASAAGSARTYVTVMGARIAGYYALSAGEVERAAAEGRLARGLGAHPVPVMLLGRLAVDGRDQRRGLGAALLRDAIARTLAVSAEVGVRALIVAAIDASAADFYTRFGFEPLPGDPLRLFVLQKDMRRLLG